MIRAARIHTICSWLATLDDDRLLAVEAFTLEQCLEQQDVGHCTEQRSSLGDSQNHAPGNVGPNQAGADGNGADGQTFSPASSASPQRSNAGGAGTSLINRELRKLRDAPAVAAPGVLLDWFDEGAER